MAETYFVGLELNNKEVRMCIYDASEKDAVTVMVTAGGSHAECPAHMTYIEKNGQWKYGIEADYFADKEGCVLFDDILETLLSGKDFEANGRSFLPEEVLAEMIRQALSFGGIKRPGEQINILMLTVPRITKVFTKEAEKAFGILGINTKRAYVQCYDESFFMHTYYQKQEVYSRKVGLFYFDDDSRVSFKILNTDRTTKPATAYVTNEGSTELTFDVRKKDERFAAFIKEKTEGKEFSSFFLVGNGFNRHWAKESLNILCRAQRKVFYGDNLYAKGACFAAREKSQQAQIKDTIFLGNDLVRKNIGMELIKDGVPAYYPLITAGIHWYEAENECDIILNYEKELVFRVSRMENGKRANYKMQLPGLPERPPKTTRLNIKLRFESPEKCNVTVSDMGFGELFPSSNLTWADSL